MDLMQAIKERHSVRQYSPDRISGDVRTTLEGLIQECNKESGLHMQLVMDDPECFDTFLSQQHRVVFQHLTLPPYAL